MPFQEWGCSPEYYAKFQSYTRNFWWTVCLGDMSYTFWSEMTPYLSGICFFLIWYMKLSFSLTDFLSGLYRFTVILVTSSHVKFKISSGPFAGWKFWKVFKDTPYVVAYARLPSQTWSNAYNLEVVRILFKAQHAMCGSFLFCGRLQFHFGKI